MRLSEEEARRRLAGTRVLRLATADTEGRPHQVPVTFATQDDVIAIAVDHKPKRHQNLKRLRNICENPTVCLLADEYSDDWADLWWVRADGEARVLEGDGRAEPVRWLVAKYPQYEEIPPAGPVIEVRVTRWSGWSYADQ